MATSSKNTMHLTIDATGKTLGRVASAAAKALMGKTTASYTPHIASDVRVTVENAKKLVVTEKKRLGKVYTTYSGYPGGLTSETLSALIARKGASEAIRRAVERMLPRNATRTTRLKRLTVTE